jgi:hypothetical protein
MQRNTIRTFSMTLAVAVALSLLVPGCSDECKRNSDCPAGSYCVHGSCDRFPDIGADADADDAPGPDADADADTETETPGPDADGDFAEVDDGEAGCTTHAECADEDPCTVDECLMAEGTCRHTSMADGEPCNDGVFCNGFETCAGGVCVSTGDPCATADPCGAGACDESTDSCRVEPAPDGTPCDNGFYCDGADECRSGLCASTGSPCSGGDGICSFSTCNEDTDSCSTTTTPDGTNCDDGNPCNGMDGCLGGTCAHDPHPLCETFITCQAGVCSPDGAGGYTCSYVDAPSGTACSDTMDTCGGSAGRVCAAGPDGATMCAAGTDALCADGSLCNVTTCRAGACTLLTPRPTPPALACGAEVRGSTATGPNDVSSYGASCAGTLTGAERVYAVAVPSGLTTLEVTITTSGASGTLSALVLSDHCTATSCLATSGSGTTVTATVTGGRTYYVVVDGLGGARGGYRLAAACR